jgi:hypothetical protein
VELSRCRLEGQHTCRRLNWSDGSEREGAAPLVPWNSGATREFTQQACQFRRRVAVGVNEDAFMLVVLGPCLFNSCASHQAEVAPLQLGLGIAGPLLQSLQ